MTAAALTHTSIRPNASPARWASACTAASSVTSVGTASARPPARSHSWAAARSDSSVRAASTTLAPRSAKASAAARAIPLEAPVMTTTDSETARFTFHLPNSAARAVRSGPKHDLLAAVLLLLEDLVPVRSLVQRQVVGSQALGAQRVGIVEQQRHDVVDPALDVALPHAQLDALVEHLQHRHRVQRPAVDTDDRHGAAAADGLNRVDQSSEPIDPELLGHRTADGIREHRRHLLPELFDRIAVAFHADGIDHPVRAAAVGGVLDVPGDVVDGVDVDHLDAVPPGRLQPFGYQVDNEDPLGAQMSGDPGARLADRA